MRNSGLSQDLEPHSKLDLMRQLCLLMALDILVFKDKLFKLWRFVLCDSFNLFLKALLFLVYFETTEVFHVIRAACKKSVFTKQTFNFVI